LNLKEEAFLHGVAAAPSHGPNLYQVHNLKAETAFSSTVNTVSTVRCFSSSLVDGGTRLDPVI